MNEAVPIVVFSHLRWDSVFQRPHHLLSRLARERLVLFVEEPVRAKSGARDAWELSRPAPNLLVARPHTDVDAPGFCEAQNARLADMTRTLLTWRGVDRHVAWLYTPMALPVAEALAPDLLVYDCMDELSAFLGAPPSLVERESELLQRADLVFTGGPSLYRAKRDRHPRVHCFPSSVDVSHFRSVREPSSELDTLPRPRLGFYGVIDERLDVELLDVLATAHPEWQVVMVGPVVKIDPGRLPRRPNVHYLGQRRYQELPGLLSDWDACLLPFAHNEATRFISPTKTLEYMAAEKPIASTSIRDVAEPYGDIVHVGDGPDGFVEACERALGWSASERETRVRRMRDVLATTSWDTTANAMSLEIDRLLRWRRTRPLRRPRLATAAAPRAAAPGL